MSREKRDIKWALSLCLLAICTQLYGQYLPEEEEAPEAIFATELGSAEVDLFVSGSWEASLEGSAGLAVRKGSAPFPAQYPGMNGGIAFIQKPDLLLSLWLNDRYFFETSVLAGYELNSLQAGYVNPEEGFLRQLIFGVPAPPVQSYGEAVFNEGAKGSFGVSVQTETDMSRHDATLRIEDFGIKRKRYIGTSEITETTIHPADYIRGRFFILPDADIDFLELYQEVSPGTGNSFSGGDGNRYAALPESSYRVSLSAGTVALDAPVEKRLLVYYEKNGLAVGDPSLGRDALTGITGGFPDPQAEPVDFSFTSTTYLTLSFDELRIEMGSSGKDALLLYDPALFSPFEECSRYDAGFDLPEERGAVELELGSPGAPLPGSPLQFVPSLFDNSQFRVYPSASGTGSGTQPGTGTLSRVRYPLAARYPYIYGPNARNGDNRVVERLLLIVKTDTGSIQLENPIPGSVIVRRNGFRETGFIVEQSGELVFDKAVQPGERIDVFYRTDSGAENITNITFGVTNGLRFPGGVFTHLTLSGTWNVNAESYSTMPNQHPGSVTLSGGIELTRQSINARADASLSVSSPDTTGNYRVFGMEGAGANFPVDRAYTFPSAQPSGVPATSDLLQTNRGILLFKEYATYGATGSYYLNRYDWTGLPEDQAYAYEEGNPTGPYTVSVSGDGVGGTDGAGSTAMAIDFVLDDQGEWVGAQMPLSPGGVPPDLSGYEGIQFYWKFAPHGETEGSVEKLRAYVQIGYLGEDLDGDGALDSESSRFDPGIKFNDQTRNIWLTVGGRTGRPDLTLTTEDTNGNGVLDAEVSQVVSRSFDPGGEDYPATRWGEPVTLLFSEEDKRLLHKASAWRIIIESKDGSRVKNRLLVSGLTMLGSPFSQYPLETGSLSIREKSDSSLLTEYPQQARRFIRDEEKQRVLAFEWTGVEPAEGWRAVGLAHGTPLSDYKELRFFILGDSGTTGDPEILLTFERGDLKALSAAFALPTDDRWHSYSVDLVTGAVSRDGDKITVADIDNSVAAVDSVSISCTGSTSGALLLDELHLAGTKLRTGFSVDAGFTASSEDPLLSAGDFPVVAKPHIELNMAVDGSAIEDGPAAATARLSTTAGADIAGAASLALRADADIGTTSTLSAGHEITIPAVSSPVSVTESFYTAGESQKEGFTHSLSVTGGVRGIAAATIASTAVADGASIERDWSGNVALFQRFPVSASIEARLARLSGEYAPQTAGYFSELREAVSQIVPVKESKETGRSAVVEAVVEAEGDSFAFAAAPSLGYSAFSYLDTLFTLDGAIAVSSPFSISLEPPLGLQIEPYYSLELERTIDNYTGIDFGPDLQAFSRELQAQAGILTFPLYDLFAPSLADNFTRSTANTVFASYLPSAGLAISRGFGSYVRDLFIPATIEIELLRSLTREEDTVTDTLSTELSLRAAALNLFGSRGAYPAFFFYESDEFTWNTGFSAGFSGGELTSYQVILQQFLFFGTAGGAELSLTNRLQFRGTGIAGASRDDSVSDTGASHEWNDTFEPVFSWITPLSRGISVPFTDIELKNDVYFLHKESFALEISGPQAAFELLAGHSSELFLGDIGSALGLLEIGVSYKDETWIFGIGGSLRVRVTF